MIVEPWATAVSAAADCLITVPAGSLECSVSIWVLSSTSLSVRAATA